MTDKAQGAVGAETMTAGKPVIRKAVFEIASSRIKSGAPGLGPATAEAIARIIGLEAANALATPRTDSDEGTKGVDDPDVAYQRGKEDGYSEGVLDAAARAGLTLEYGASSDPERHVPGPVEVLARIAEHEDVRRWRDEDTRQLATAAAEAASLRAEVEAKDRALAEIVRIYDGPEINPVAAERMGKIARTALGSAATTETAKSWPRAPQPFLKRGYDSLWIAEWRAKTGGALGEAKKAHNEALRVARAATAREEA